GTIRYTCTARSAWAGSSRRTGSSRRRTGRSGSGCGPPAPPPPAPTRRYCGFRIMPTCGRAVRGVAGENDVVAQGELNPKVWLTLLRRRRYWFLGATLSILLASLLLAFLLPPVYRSQSTILIEQQEVPQDIVRSAVTSFADQRIQMISQRVMTRANLLDLIHR